MVERNEPPTEMWEMNRAEKMVPMGLELASRATEMPLNSTSLPAMGFNGIAAAFLGGLNPIGAIFSSYFIQHITNGGAYVDKTMYSAQISDLISALIIYLCGFVLFFKVFMNSRLDRRDEKRRAKEDRPGSEEGGKA